MLGKLATCRKKMDLYLIPFTQINLKWIKGLNVRYKTTKLLKHHIEKMLLGFSFGNNILDMTPKVQATKAKINM